jgi:hypothetical protein
MPMFNNRGDDLARVEMRVVVTLIRARDLQKPLRPLYAKLAERRDSTSVFRSART